MIKFSCKVSQLTQQRTKTKDKDEREIVEVNLMTKLTLKLQTNVQRFISVFGCFSNVCFYSTQTGNIWLTSLNNWRLKCLQAQTGSSKIYKIKLLSQRLERKVAGCDLNKLQRHHSVMKWVSSHLNTYSCLL